PAIAPGAPTSAEPDTPPSRLPRSLTRLIGREQERAELADLLGAARLVTVTGPPGTGKTRLAIEVAADLGDRFADRVLFVSLAPFVDPATVLPTIARAAGAEGL